MNIYKVILLGIYALTALMNVVRIGKAARPVTPAVAAGSLVVTGVLASLVVLA